MARVGPDRDRVLLKALWGFVLGYVITSLIQALVTRARTQEAMGQRGPRSVGLAAFFGFISSSCSFAALASTRAIMRKGVALVPSLAYLLASTNLVVELGIVIAIFLGWQFVAAEYIGGPTRSRWRHPLTPCLRHL